MGELAAFDQPTANRGEAVGGHPFPQPGREFVERLHESGGIPDRGQLRGDAAETGVLAPEGLSPQLGAHQARKGAQAFHALAGFVDLLVAGAGGAEQVSDRGLELLAGHSANPGRNSLAADQSIGHLDSGD